MFDFEKLDLYQIVKDQNFKTLKLLFSSNDIDKYIIDQYKKASLSMLLNLVEGTGRITTADKKHFLTIARGSVFECAALLETIYMLGHISEDVYKDFYSSYETISKMMLGMFRSFDKPSRTDRE